MNRVIIHALFLLLVPTLAGCITDGPDKDDQTDGSLEPPRLNFAVAVPIVIEETESPHGFWLVWYHEPEGNCRWTPRPYEYHKLMDMNGMVYEKVVAIGDEPVQRFWVPLSGKGPWVFIGGSHPCNDIWRNHLEGVTKGYQMLGKQGSWGVGQVNESVLLSIKKGETTATTSWAGTGENITGTFGASPYIREGRGAFKGEVRMSYPDGETWRWDRFSLGGDRDAEFQPLQYFIGEYAIEFKADFPVLEDVLIEYEIYIYRLDHRACQHGFAWQMCQEGDR